eukprot:SM000128S26235  [mRNA]  locus=s128:237422:251878:- [translate_table: standard]
MAGEIEVVDMASKKSHGGLHRHRGRANHSTKKGNRILPPLRKGRRRAVPDSWRSAYLIIQGLPLDVRPGCKGQLAEARHKRIVHRRNAGYRHSSPLAFSAAFLSASQGRRRRFDQDLCHNGRKEDLNKLLEENVCTLQQGKLTEGDCGLWRNLKAGRVYEGDAVIEEALVERGDDELLLWLHSSIRMKSGRNMFSLSFMTRAAKASIDAFSTAPTSQGGSILRRRTQCLEEVPRDSVMVLTDSEFVHPVYKRLNNSQQHLHWAWSLSNCLLIDGIKCTRTLEDSADTADATTCNAATATPLLGFCMLSSTAGRAAANGPGASFAYFRARLSIACHERVIMKCQQSRCSEGHGKELGDLAGHVCIMLGLVLCLIGPSSGVAFGAAEVLPLLPIEGHGEDTSSLSVVQEWLNYVLQITKITCTTASSCVSAAASAVMAPTKAREARRAAMKSISTSCSSLLLRRSTKADNWMSLGLVGIAGFERNQGLEDLLLPSGAQAFERKACQGIEQRFGGEAVDEHVLGRQHGQCDLPVLILEALLEDLQAPCRAFRRVAVLPGTAGPTLWSWRAPPTGAPPPRECVPAPTCTRQLSSDTSELLLQSGKHLLAMVFVGGRSQLADAQQRQDHCFDVAGKRHPSNDVEQQLLVPLLPRAAINLRYFRKENRQIPVPLRKNLELDEEEQALLSHGWPRIFVRGIRRLAQALEEGLQEGL